MGSVVVNISNSLLCCSLTWFVCGGVDVLCSLLQGSNLYQNPQSTLDVRLVH